MLNRRILVTGASGLLGPYLLEAASRFGDPVATGRRDRTRRCDLTSVPEIEALITDVRPDVVIHAAAMTNVDQCEQDPKKAYAINRDAPAHLAAALPADVRLVYISSDQVYPDREGPHAEDAAEPINIYGKSKFAGEEAIARRHGSLVVRTNIFGPSRTPGRRSLSDFVLDSIASERPFTLFDDLLFSPLHLTTLAGLIFELVETGVSMTCNLGSRSGMSKKDFGMAVADQKGLKARHAKTVRSTDIPERAPRPKDLRLDLTLVESVLGRAMPTLNDEIQKL